MSNEPEGRDRQLEDAAYAYTIGSFDEAFAGYSRLVDSGNPDAAVGLAHMYLRGEGVSASVEKGLELFRLAASLGNATAAFSLGALHRSGDCNVPIDPEKSKQFFLLAKKLGCELPIEPYL
jgi:TPR repeat protein